MSYPSFRTHAFSYEEVRLPLARPGTYAPFYIVTFANGTLGYDSVRGVPDPNRIVSLLNRIREFVLSG